MTLFESIGGTEGCRKLSTAFYTRVARDPVLRPLFPGKSMKCRIEALESFLVQFLGGPNQDTQSRWRVSLRESHAQFSIGPRERDAWLANMRETLVEMDNPAAAEALSSFFDVSSAYIAHTRSPQTLPPELQPRWQNQLNLDQAIAAIVRGDGTAAIQFAEAARQHSRSAYLGLLSRMLPIAPEYVRNAIRNEPELIKERYFGWSPLHLAAAAGDLATVELVLQLGADPNLADGTGHPPLYSVSNQCQTASGADVVHALVRAGANVNARSGVKRVTALHMAARRGNAEIGRALLECGADPGALDSQGVTPLQRAINCRKDQFVGQ